MRTRKRGGYEVDYREKCHWETVSGAWLIVLFMRLGQNNSRRREYLRQKDGGLVLSFRWVLGRLEPRRLVMWPWRPARAGLQSKNALQELRQPGLELVLRLVMHPHNFPMCVLRQCD